MQVLKQPVCTSEQARQLLADLKAAYLSLGSSDRAAVRTALEQDASTNTFAPGETANTVAACTFYLADPISHAASTVF